MKNETLLKILKHVPQEELTEHFIVDLNVDLSARGYHYLQRCFIDDSQGHTERAVSDHFRQLWFKRGLPPAILNNIKSEGDVRLLATMYQWLCTNVGFSELETAFNKGGRRLYWTNKEDKL